MHVAKFKLIDVIISLSVKHNTETFLSPTCICGLANQKEYSDSDTSDSCLVCGFTKQFKNKAP